LLSLEQSVLFLLAYRIPTLHHQYPEGKKWRNKLNSFCVKKAIQDLQYAHHHKPFQTWNITDIFVAKVLRQWATCTKRSRDQIKRLGKNKAQKWKEHIKISYTANFQLIIHNTTKMTIKFVRWVVECTVFVFPNVF